MTFPEDIFKVTGGDRKKVKFIVNNHRKLLSNVIYWKCEYLFRCLLIHQTLRKELKTNECACHRHCGTNMLETSGGIAADVIKFASQIF